MFVSFLLSMSLSSTFLNNTTSFLEEDNVTNYTTLSLPPMVVIIQKPKSNYTKTIVARPNKYVALINKIDLVSDDYPFYSSIVFFNVSREVYTDDMASLFNYKYSVAYFGSDIDELILKTNQFIQENDDILNAASNIKKILMIKPIIGNIILETTEEVPREVINEK